MLEWFKARVDWHDGLQNLSDTEAGRFAKSLWKYMATNEEDRLSGKEGMMLSIALAYLRREQEERARTSALRSEAGKMGGRPKKQPESKKANAFFEKQTKAKKAEKEEEQEKDTTTPLPPSPPDDENGGGGSSYIANALPGMTVGNWEELRSFLDDGLGMDVVRYAVDEAAAHGSRTWAYVRRVLSRCLTQGITTAQQAKASAHVKTDVTDTEESERKRREDERMLARLRGELPL